MWKNLWTWVKDKRRKPPDPGRLASWIGQNWARVHYATRVEPTWLELTRHQVPVRGLPPEFHGMRILQLSDLHCSRHVTPTYLAEAVDLAQAQSPDLVVLTGDFIHHGFKYIPQVAHAVSRLHATHGTFAVLGNHDYSVRNALGLRRHRHLHKAVADALSNRAIRVLRNETVLLHRGDSKLQLTGVEDLWSRACDLEAAYAGSAIHEPRIVLAHNPCTIEHLEGRRCDLMLSGHTHGGQINLPRLGRVTLGPNGKRYAAGMYEVEDSRLYVHRGVGFGFKVRFNVRPEVALLTLQASAPA